MKTALALGLLGAALLGAAWLALAWADFPRCVALGRFAGPAARTLAWVLPLALAAAALASPRAAGALRRAAAQARAEVTEDRGEVPRLRARLEQNDSPHHRLRLAAALLRRARAAEAEAVLRPALETDPGLVEGWFRLGQCRLDLDRLAEAVQALEETVRREPDYAFGEAQRLLGEALARAGRPEPACAALAGYLARHPGDPRAHFRHGECLARLGRTVEAGAEMRRAAEAVALAPPSLRRRDRGIERRARAWLQAHGAGGDGAS